MYYGESLCQGFYKTGAKAGSQCVNKAYYLQDEKGYCGVHSNVNLRQKLKVNPNAKQQKEEKIMNDMKIVEESKTENQGKVGKVIVSKLRMRQAPPDVPGYLKVFPNYRHSKRENGLGVATLSPMSLGPVNHIMPNLPPSQNLENFYQSMKVFSCDLDANGNLTPEAIQLRIDRFNDKTPYRHKYQRGMKPLYSWFYDKDGKGYKFTYIGSRYFYCKKYEELVTKMPDRSEATAAQRGPRPQAKPRTVKRSGTIGTQNYTVNSEFNKLKELLNQGYNLQILGYDGYMPDKSLLEHYIDESRPFGHELVLYTLLTVNDSAQYPWNIVYEKNKEMYDRIGI